MGQIRINFNIFFIQKIIFLLKNYTFYFLQPKELLL